ncbi:MAG: Na+/H+ antiporter NhaA [Bacteroidetes bacterium]|nr:Na+/H+ antiporter NhaA [Bacteroidota bacterium]
MVRDRLKNARFPRLTNLFTGFYAGISSGGTLLVICALVSLLLSNSSLAPSWLNLWSAPLDPHLPGLHSHSLTGWINDGLMTVFFLLVGLEIERELLVGELSDFRTALLPVVAAVGGMAVPALLYFLVNLNQTQLWNGAGIPTATDIAFAIAIMRGLGNKVPAALKVFLTALAIIDDLGAIAVIAIFYGQGIHTAWLLATLGIFGFLLFLRYLKVNQLWVYLLLGILLWYCMMHSGIHATLAGVLLAFTIPFNKKDEDLSPSGRLMHKLHKPVGNIILPLFALANTAIAISRSPEDYFLSPLSLGILTGLVVGKPLGIFLASWISLRMRMTSLPSGVTVSQILGAGMLGGIGFTMAIFVANLAFDNQTLIETAKVSILIASTLSAVLGYFWLGKRRAGKIDPQK